MSEFTLSFEKRAKYVYIKGTGIRKNLAVILESTHEFARIVEETKPSFILVDYSELVTIITNSDVFNITRMYENTAPALYKLCIAIIINPNEAEVEKFWEEICTKRGFDFKIFADPEEAEKWLMGKIDVVPGWQFLRPS